MKNYLLLLIFTINYTYGQFPEKKYSNEVAEFNDKRNGLNIGVGYINTTFVNPVFRNNLDASKFKRNIGLNFKLAYIYKALIIDANGFYSGFDIDKAQLQNLPSNLSIDTLMFKHQGYDVFISCNILPTKNKWLREHITPYVGLGYQFSALALTNKKIIIEPKSYSVYKLNSPMWKAGFYLNFHKYFNVYGEFKQTLSFESDDPNKLFQLNAGFSFKYSR